MEIPHPPEGTPEYENWKAQDKAPSIIITCWMIIGLATVFTICRLFVRIRVFRQLRSDDFWCAGGLIAAYLSAAFTTVAVGYGNGRHFNLLTQVQQENVIFWTTVAFCPSILSFGLPKLAVVALLTRLMNPGKAHKYFLWGMTVFCVLSLLATIGTLLGQCQPAESLWNFDIQGTCAPKHHIVNYSLYAGTISAFVDIYLAIYPSLVLFKLQLKLRKKIALSFALGIGLVSGGFAVYKTTRIPQGLASPDFSYDSADLIIWTLVEGCSIIIACSIPVLQPLMEIIFKRRNPFRSTSRNKHEQYQDMSNPHRHTGSGSSPRRPRRTFDDLEETYIGDSDSHELVSPHKTKEVEAMAFSDAYPRGPSQPWPLTPEPPRGAIMRTDEVTLTFDSDSTKTNSAEKLPRS